MDFSNIMENLPFFLGLIVLIFVQFFMRKRNSKGSQQDMVQGVLAETRLDIKFAESFTYDIKSPKFMTTSWKLYRDRMDFLDPKLQTQLNDAFMLADDYNRLLNDAKKNKSASYLSGMDMSRLKDLLEKCKEGLENWLLANTGSTNPPERNPSAIDMLLGKR